MAVFNPVKVIWDKKLIAFGKSRIGRGSMFLTKDIFSKFLGEVWKDCMKPANIKMGFEATGILPFNPDKFDKKLFDKHELSKYEAKKRQDVTRPQNAPPLSSTTEQPSVSSHPILVENLDVESAHHGQALDLSLKVQEPSPAKPMTILDIFVQKVRQGSEEVPKSLSNVRLKSNKYGEVVTSDDVLERMKKVELTRADKEKKKHERDEKKRKDCGPEMGLKKKKKKTPVVELEESDIDGDLKMEEEKMLCQEYSDGETEEMLEEEKRDEVKMDENVRKEVNEFVLFSYEGELFPGQIIHVHDNGARIKSMQKCGKAWKWPDHIDIMFYQWSDVKATIKPIKISSRRDIYKIPELDARWA